MARYRILMNCFSIALAALLLGWPSALACCSVTSEGGGTRIGSQRVLIVWDPATKTEHFIREANFLGADKDFGFLVPTPSEPQLAEAAASLFEELELVVRPRIEQRRTWTFRFWDSLLREKYKSSTGSSSERLHFDSVEVLQETLVAGFQAVVLQSTSAPALAAWLKAHNYHMRESVAEWLEPYVAAGWKISAFRFASESRATTSHPFAERRTRCVKMSFKTDSPLFPYRVPKDELASSGESPAGVNELDEIDERTPTPLRLFFVGPERVDGLFEDSNQSWKPRMLYAGPAAALADLAPPAGAWLTAFEDEGWPGGLEDLRFKKSATQEPYQRVIIEYQETVIHLLDPLRVIGILLFSGLALWFRRKRRSGAQS